jgi:hypothetical protein
MLFRQLICALMGAVVMLLATKSIDAHAAEWPLVFSFKQIPVIPDGGGMIFFHGVWKATGRDGGGDMTVTKDAIEFRDASTPTYSPYKVIHTAPNYVLIVTKYTFRDGDQWTKFRIFNLYPNRRNSEKASRTSELREHYCTELSMERPEPFDWSVEKLIEVFKSSRCLKKIDDDAWYASIGWSNSRYSSTRKR